MLHHTYSAAVLFFWLSSTVHVTSHTGMPIFRFFRYFWPDPKNTCMLIFSIFSYFIFLFLNFLSLFVFIFCEVAHTRRFSVIFAKVQYTYCYSFIFFWLSTLHHTYSAAVLFFWLSSIVHITSHIFCCCSVLLIVEHSPCYITHILLLSILLIVEHSPCYITHILLLSILLIVKHRPHYITHILLLSILLIVKHSPHCITHILLLSILLIVKHSPRYITHILLLFYSSDCQASSALHHTYSAAVLFFWLSSIVHVTSHIFCCFSILLIVKHSPHYITHILLFFYSSDCQASSTLHHTPVDWSPSSYVGH